jgi:membrane protein required for colicin V production
MARWIESPALDLWAARLAVLVGVLLLGGILTWLISMAIHGSRLGAPDRAAGMAFGVARGVLLVGVVLVVLRVAGFSGEPWWRESKLVPYAAPVADALREAAEHELGKPGSLSGPLAPGRLPGMIGS